MLCLNNVVSIRRESSIFVVQLFRKLAQSLLYAKSLRYEYKFAKLQKNLINY